MMPIRRAKPEDRQHIEEILRATERFSEQEVLWAIELVDDALEKASRSQYVIHVLEGQPKQGESVVKGYTCYAPTPLTEGVFDLYWIAVDPRFQRKGAGGELLAAVEEEVRGRSGRMLLIETSSKESYQPTISFYEKKGYQEISRIKDFYRIEDDKIVLSKQL